MDAAALTARSWRGRASPTTGAVAEPALAFHAPGGPLLVVCGLVGGAGASTLAYLVARRAARHSSRPVLLTEFQEQAALAALTGTRSPLGLRELARAVEEQRDVAQPFTELPGGLRLIATAHPAGGKPVAAPALAQVLEDAREAHGLVVVDAGPPGGSDNDILLATASHVLFVLPATAPALRQAELLAAGGIFARATGGRATLVAIATHRGRGADVKQLRRLAERHVDRLLLIPHVTELAAGKHHQGDARLEDTFATLATLLRRPR